MIIRLQSMHLVLVSFALKNRLLGWEGAGGLAEAIKFEFFEKKIYIHTASWLSNI